MKYTSNEKLDFDEINKKAKATGFSDRARRVLSSALLGIHIMGAVPSFGNEVQATEYDLNTFNGPQFEEILDYDNDKDEQLNNIVTAYGKTAEIDRSNLDEFNARGVDALSSSLNNGGRYAMLPGMNGWDVQDLEKLKAQGVTHAYFLDKSKTLEENKAAGLDPLELCPIDDAIMLKKHMDKYYGPIKDNPRLSQQEKFIAAMMVLEAITTYDHQAYQPDNPTEYSKASEVTSRSQYSAVKYGQTICVGYADSVEKISDFLGIDCEQMSRYYL